MNFDFSTLVTDRTQADVNRVKQIAEKIKNGTASESELAEFNSAAMKGAYNHTDLNRVTAAMEALKAKLEGYGYAVPGYQRIEVPHPSFVGGSRLPEGYTELAWIESTGTQYVDTGFVPNQDTRVICKAQCTDVSVNGCLFGARYSTSRDRYEFLVAGSNFFSAYNTGGGTSKAASTDWLEIDKNKNITTLNGVEFSAHTYAAFQCPCNLLLFSDHTNGTPNLQAKAKIYCCQIYDNGTLVRDFVPCINPSGDVGLFDLVTAAFFGNSGTGSFVAGAVPRKLPDGYTQVEYIESSGTQYIDTGFVPNQGTRVVCDCEYEATSAASWLFGVRVASGSGAFAFLAYSSKFRTDYGSSHELYFATTITKATSVDKNKNVTTVNGSATLTDASATFSSKYNLALFAINTAGTISGYAKAKIKSCQIYDNGVIVRDYVPCINPNGSVGLYDLVTAAFFGNSGTGSFVAGAIPRELPEGYTQVEYIQSSGTQYIDTGFVPNQDTRVVMDIDLTSAFSAYGWITLFATRNGSSVGFGLFSNAAMTSVYHVYASKNATISTSLKGRHTVDKNKNETFIDGNSIGSFAYTAFIAPLQLRLLYDNQPNGGDKHPFVGKVYSCQIYDNGTLVRDYVPCKNVSGVFGLYDLANDVFYQNAGTGTFVAGEEVVASATASVMVVSDDVTEYDPYTWYEFDWPTPETMTVYLLNVVALRSVFAVMKSTPSVPKDAVGLMVQEANNIEKILVDTNELLMKSTQVWFYSGDLFAGEVD